MLAVRCATHPDPSVQTSTATYQKWYSKMWKYAKAYFIDERGGWYPMLNAQNVRTDLHAAADHTGSPVKCYPSKTDYHPLAACWEVLRALEADASG